MKSPAFPWFVLTALLMLPGRLSATTPTPDPENPYANLDPDGVPIAVTREAKRAPTAEQIEAMSRQQSRDRNWLMLQFEEEIRTHAQKAGRSAPTNIYLQLSMNKNLAQLAGLQPLDPVAALPPSLHANPPPPAPNTTVLRPAAPVSTGMFTPLLSPQSAIGGVGVQKFAVATFASSFPSILPPSPYAFAQQATPAPAPAPAPHSSSFTEAFDLQTPGMVAAEDDPGAQTATSDLGVEALPGETANQAREREEANTRLELPKALTADQIRQDQAAKLKPATAVVPAAPKTATTQAPKAVPVNPEDAPTPVSQQQEVIPVHGAIANPYDILNR